MHRLGLALAFGELAEESPQHIGAGQAWLIFMSLCSSCSGGVSATAAARRCAGLWGAALRRNKCGCAMSRSAKLGNGAASTGGCLSRDFQTHSLPTNSQTHRGHWQHVGHPPEQCVPWDHARQSPKLAGLCSARGTNYSPALPALPSPLTNCFRSAKACGHIN